MGKCNTCRKEVTGATCTYCEQDCCDDSKCSIKCMRCESIHGESKHCVKCMVNSSAKCPFDMRWQD